METAKPDVMLAAEIEKKLRDKMGPVLERYGLNVEALVRPLQWRPLVLIIGNYSSGKSTFINELLGTDVQRTGQAPTDDSFTILTSPGPGEDEAEVPGATVVNDDSLPFESLRSFGDALISHLRLKRINSPLLRDLAIIDTPGMLDSVTEKDRGYDYLGVVGELSRMADLIILMFDPHKAGTINETYKAIRGTLPESAGEDRVLYVLNRIDECENVADLVRAYGTLCWNLSQMTGRKDIPRIFLTFSPNTGRIREGFDVWIPEREELKRNVSKAPQLRLNHILQEVDRVLRELMLEVEALASFQTRFKRRFWSVAKTTGFIGLIAFFFTDLFMKLAIGYPNTPLISALIQGNVGFDNLLWPIVSCLAVLGLSSLYVQRILFPRHTKMCIEQADSLVTLDTDYLRDVWSRIKPRVINILNTQAKRQLWVPHKKNIKRIKEFLRHDLAEFYGKVRKGWGQD